MLAEIDEIKDLARTSNLVLAYKVCESSDTGNCYFTESELNFSGRNSLTELRESEDYVTYGSIEHDPESLGTDRSTYVYQFAVYNPNSERAMANFRMDSLVAFSQVLDEDTWYTNSKRAGETVYYEFNTANYDFENIRNVKIIVESLNGDADLFVSSKNSAPSKATDYEFSSQLDITYDQVEIERTQTSSIKDTFYVGVFCRIRTAFRVRWVIEYGPLFHATLKTATPLVDSVPIADVLKKETEQGFYSFSPWWSGSEESIIVLAAEVTFGSAYFYSAIDKYPRHYIGSKDD